MDEFWEGGLGAVAVSHVCRYWRQVALADPVFWSFDIFELNHPGAIAAKLERSRNAPLYIRVNSTSIPISMAKPHVGRFRALRLCGLTTERSCLSRPTGGSLPLLETLELGPAPDHDGIKFLGSSTFHDVDDHWVDDAYWARNPAFPVLRHLRLSHRVLGWDSPLYSSRLTHLEVEYLLYNCQAFSGHTRSHMFSTLGKMSSLQTLILVYIIPKDNGCSPEAIPTIPLPSLQKLVVFDLPSRCTSLLERLSVPSFAHILLNCDTFRKPNEDYHTTIPYIARQASGCGPLLSLEIEVFYRKLEHTDVYKKRVIDVKGWDVNFDGDVWGMRLTDRLPCIGFSFTAAENEAAFRSAQTFAVIRDALGPHLTSLAVLAITVHSEDGEPRLTENGLYSILEFMPNLQSLFLEDEAVYPVLRLLAMNNLSPAAEAMIGCGISSPIWTQQYKIPSQSDEPSSVVLHRLQRLTLYKASLLEITYPERWLLHDMLTRTLAARRALQSDGQTFNLSLESTVIDRVAVMKVVDVVPRVEWHGPRYWILHDSSSDERDAEDEEVVNEWKKKKTNEI